MEIKISAILPCYNIGKYLPRCLDSILRQSFPYWEVIIIDDGSTDNTLEIGRRYASEHQRISVYHFKNQGVSQARNEGIRYAKGELIHFIDPDDYIEPDCFKVCYETYQKYGADCIHFNKYIHRWDTSEPLSDGELDFKILTGNDIFKEYTSALIGIGQETLNHWYKGESLWKYKKPWQGWSFMFSRKVIEENHIIFQPSLKTSEDALFIVDYSIFSKKIARIPNYLYHYDFRKEGCLFSRISDSTKIFDDKYRLIEQRERIRRLINKNSQAGKDFISYYLGSNIFSCIELLLKLNKNGGGYSLCNEYITDKRIQESIKLVDVSNAPLKFKIPVLLLKMHCQAVLFYALRGLNRIGLLDKIHL